MRRVLPFLRSGRDGTALGHRVDRVVTVAELAQNLARMRADLRRRRGHALLGAGYEHGTVDGLDPSDAGQSEVDERPAVSHLRVGDDLVDLRQRRPFDVVLAKHGAQLGEVARFELRLQDCEQLGGMSRAALDGREQRIRRQLRGAEARAQARELAVGVELHEEEHLAVAAPVAVDQRIHRIRADGAVREGRIADLRLQVAGVRPDAACEQRSADFRSTSGALAIVQSEHDSAEERHRGRVVADRRTRHGGDPSAPVTPVIRPERAQ